jgi:hypothetical protein
MWRRYVCFRLNANIRSPSSTVLKMRLVKNRFDGHIEKLRNAECQRE